MSCHLNSTSFISGVGVGVGVEVGVGVGVLSGVGVGVGVGTPHAVVFNDVSNL